MSAWSVNERVISMNAETARLALEALAKILGGNDDLEIEMTMKEEKDARLYD